MKYSPHIYAHALAQAIIAAKGADHDGIAKNFLALVRKNGDETSLRKIVAEAERLIHKESGARKVTIISARPVKHSAEAMLKSILKPGDAIEEKIDPRLIAGIKILINDESEFDGSLKGKLDAIFSNVI